MKEALVEAKKAFEKGEVPIGAVGVYKDNIIARSHNLKEKEMNATRHAEIILIDKLSKAFSNWRLTGVDIYVTIEPCIMCMGALIHSRISSLIFAANDKKFGAANSLYKLSYDKRLNHNFEIRYGILEEESIDLMKKFFISRRNKER